MARSLVFISYSREDELEKNILLSHLAVLESVGLIDLWSDDRIAAGEDWNKAISQAISQAKVVILLVTANFLNSKFILSDEVPKILERYSRRELTIIPIIARACRWESVDWLARMQVRPKDGRPIWSYGDIDRSLAEIVREVATIIEFSSAYKGLDKVEFGHIAAEEEIQELQKYFIQTKEYSSVISERGKLLVIGRKGSGKSAIYVTLRDHLPLQDSMAVVEALTLENYPWNVHKQIVDRGVPVEQSYVNSWKYIVWVILAKKILGYSQTARYKIIDPLLWKRIFNANRRYLTRFLFQNYGSIAPSFTELLADRARQVRSLTLKDFGVATAPGDDPFHQLSQSINIVNQEIEARILEILSDDRHYLLFDQLDLGWDDTEASKQLLIGLILAARDVTRVARAKGKHVQVTIFLRSDIYESLRFEDKNKLSPDVVELKWDKERLKELVLKRIEASATGTWDDVFDYEDIESRVSILDYMVERTMLRPRDMIQFCVYSKDAAMKLQSFEIDGNSVKEAEYPYSGYMRKEIQDESKASIYDIDLLFEIIGEIGTEIITRKDFLRACKSRNIADEEAALRQLINLSVLGIRRPSKLDNISNILFRYSASPWERLEPSSELFVHPSLKHELGLIESSRY